ncbi:MAG: DUF2147 domain-containing protein, partial [Mesorhizobium sp.]
MFRKLTVAAAATLVMTFGALADPIEGNWKTDSGETASIASSGAITLKTG